MKFMDGTRVDTRWATKNPLRETVLRLDDMRKRGVGLCIECMEEEPIYAKNRCRACYEWLRREERAA